MTEADPYTEGYQSVMSDAGVRSDEYLQTTIAHWRHGTMFGSDTGELSRGIVDACVDILVMRGSEVPRHDMEYRSA